MSKIAFEEICFENLGDNMQKHIKENSIAILGNYCLPIPYKNGHKNIILSFELKGSLVEITKSIEIDFQEQPKLFCSITKSDLEKISVIIHGKVYSIDELKNLKAIPKMCNLSEAFKKQYLKLLNSLNPSEKVILQKSISQHVLNYKENPYAWSININDVDWDKETDNSKEPLVLEATA